MGLKVGMEFRVVVVVRLRMGVGTGIDLIDLHLN